MYLSMVSFSDGIEPGSSWMSRFDIRDRALFQTIPFIATEKPRDLKLVEMHSWNLDGCLRW